MDTKITDKLCTHAFWVSVIGVVICSSYGLSPFRSPTITITIKTCCPLDIYEQISGELKSVESNTRIFIQGNAFENVGKVVTILSLSTCDLFHLAWWRHQMETFSCYWPFVRGIHRLPVNSPHKGQWRRPLMFSLICAWINAWVNNCEAADLRRLRAHYDVIVMHLGDRYWMLMYSSTR